MSNVVDILSEFRFWFCFVKFLTGFMPQLFEQHTNSLDIKIILVKAESFSQGQYGSSRIWIGSGQIRSIFCISIILISLVKFS